MASSSQSPLGHNFGSLTYVIAMDTEIDRERLKMIGVEGFRVVEGVKPEDIPTKIDENFTKGRLSAVRRGGLMGAFCGHVNAWKAIRDDGDRGGVVLESDARLVRAMPALSTLPDNRVTILGGNLRKKATEKNADFELISEFGMRLPNDLPDNEVWINSLAYYVPPGVGKHLLKKVRKPTRKF